MLLRLPAGGVGVWSDALQLRAAQLDVASGHGVLLLGTAGLHRTRDGGILSQGSKPRAACAVVVQKVSAAAFLLMCSSQAAWFAAAAEVSHASPVQFEFAVAQCVPASERT
jgi:hypothetical protein